MPLQGSGFPVEGSGILRIVIRIPRIPRKKRGTYPESPKPLDLTANDRIMIVEGLSSLIKWFRIR